MAEESPQKFIISTKPSDHSSAVSRLVRSHAAKSSSLQSTITRASNRRLRLAAIRSKPTKSPEHSRSPPKQYDSVILRCGDSTVTSSASAVLWTLPQTIPVASTPAFHLPYLPAVVANYLDKLALPIPEIDGTEATGLMAKSFFPMILHSPAAFEVTMLFSASHLASSLPEAVSQDDLLQLKQFALASLSKQICLNRLDDETISAVAKMACYEAIFGSVDVYHVHMEAVAKMIVLRGGIEKLGLGGFLARMMLFIDTNSAYLHHTELHLEPVALPRREPETFINPARFVGE